MGNLPELSGCKVGPPLPREQRNWSVAHTLRLCAVGLTELSLGLSRADGSTDALTQGIKTGGRRSWSGLRGSNPCPRLGKPLYYHCTKPAHDNWRMADWVSR